MASKQQITDAIKATRLVPLFSHDDATIVQQAVQALYMGGIRVFEFTNRRKNSFETFQHLVNQRGLYPEMMLGVGTVMDGATAKKYIDVGADFIISPILRPEMAEVCKQHNLHWIPGCGTLTEIVNARDLGAEIIKVFPGAVLGPAFVSSIMPVVPGLQLMITGGVEPSEENLSAWFGAGAFCVGLGSQLFTREIIEHRDWSELQRKVAAALALIKKIEA